MTLVDTLIDLEIKHKITPRMVEELDRVNYCQSNTHKYATNTVFFKIRQELIANNMISADTPWEAISLDVQSLELVTNIFKQLYKLK